MGLLVSPTHLNTLTETRYYKYKPDQILTHFRRKLTKYIFYYFDWNDKIKYE